MTVVKPYFDDEDDDGASLEEYFFDLLQVPLVPVESQANYLYAIFILALILQSL